MNTTILRCTALAGRVFDDFHRSKRTHRGATRLFAYIVNQKSTDFSLLSLAHRKPVKTISIEIIVMIQCTMADVILFSRRTSLIIQTYFLSMRLKLCFKNVMIKNLCLSIVTKMQ